MENQGNCKRINTGSGTILLQIDKENFNVINKLQKVSCTKMKIGDFIVIDDYRASHHIFSQDLKPKDFKPTHRSKYKLNKEKTKITASWTSRTKESYLIIENQAHVDALKLIDNTLKVEIGLVAVTSKWTEVKIMTHEEFLNDFRIVR